MSARRRLIVLGVVVVVATVVAFVIAPTQSDFEDAFAGGGVVGPLVYVAAYALLTVLFIPGTPLTLAAGALYGVPGGFAVSMAGASLGAVGAFLISRRSAGEVLGGGGGGGPRMQRIRVRLEGNGLLALFVLRLLPIVPFNALNYAAGATSISLRDYTLATVFGIAPGVLVYVALGDGLSDPLSPLFIGAVVLTVVLALAARAASKREEPPGE